MIAHHTYTPGLDEPVVPYLALVLVILCGLLILDVTLEWWKRSEGVARARRRERDRQRVEETLARTGGRRDARYYLRPRP